MSKLFFNHATTTNDYTLSLHDALPISVGRPGGRRVRALEVRRHDARRGGHRDAHRDRKSTRLNSSHMSSSYAVFCLKKKTCARLTAMPSLRSVTICNIESEPSRSQLRA